MLSVLLFDKKHCHQLPSCRASKKAWPNRGTPNPKVQREHPVNKQTTKKQEHDHISHLHVRGTDDK